MKENNLQTPPLFSNLNQEWAVLQNYITATGNSIHAFQRVGETLEPVIISRDEQNALMVRPQKRGLSGFQFMGFSDARGVDILIPHANVDAYRLAYEEWLDKAKRDRLHYDDEIVEVLEVEAESFSTYIERLKTYVDYTAMDIFECRNTWFENVIKPSELCMYFTTGVNGLDQGAPALSCQEGLEKLLLTMPSHKMGIDKTIDLATYDPTSVDKFNSNAYVSLDISESNEKEIFIPIDEIRPTLIYLRGCLYIKARFGKAPEWNECKHNLDDLIQQKDGYIRMKVIGSFDVSPRFTPSVVGLPDSERAVDIFFSSFYYYISHYPELPAELVS